MFQPRSCRIAALTLLFCISKVASAAEQPTAVKPAEPPTTLQLVEQPTTLQPAKQPAIQPAQQPMTLQPVDVRQSDFCKVCVCSTSTGNDTSIDCSNRDISNILYKNSSWIGAGNVSYPILGLYGQHTNLVDLKTKFPKSDIVVLDFSDNSIKEVGEGIFLDLQGLELLILNNNQIEYLSPDVFKGQYQPGSYLPLRALKILMLANNKMHTLHQDLFEHTPSLETLSLSGNPLKILDIHTQIAIGSISKLQHLDLSYTQLDTIPEHFFHTPKYLQTLNLTGNLFTEVPKQLKETHALKMLVFNGNPIEKLTHHNGFPHIAHLKKLYVCDMPVLNEIGAHVFGNLNDLSELHISGNRNLTKLHHAALMRKHNGEKVWPNLFKIYLQNNSLTHLDKHIVNDWKHLHDFDISGNPWQCDCQNHWLIFDLVGLSKPKSKKDELLHGHHINKLVCAGPGDFKGMKIHDLSRNKTLLNCQTTTVNIHSYVLVGIISALLVTICVLGVLTILFKRKQISYKKIREMTNVSYHFKPREDPSDTVNITTT